MSLSVISYDKKEQNMKQYCNENDIKHSDLIMTKREFLSKFGMGFGTLGLTDILSLDLNAASTQSNIHYPGKKAKRVIQILFSGGQSHIDTWDDKPELRKIDGQPVPGMNGLANGSPFEFKNYGKSGLKVSSAFDKTAKFIDDALIINSLTTDVPAHEVATIMMNTGNLRLVRPSVGSWVVYGLGSMNENLPAFVSLRTGGLPLGGTQNFGSAFLPGMYQATPIDTSLRSVDQMIANIKNKNISSVEQRKQLDAFILMNEVHKQKLMKDKELESRMNSFELAFKMQTEATDAFDINKEDKKTRDLYGNTAQGKQMLIARRLAERGVRFVQVWTGGWDNHNEIKRSLGNAASQVDQPIAALIQDLKQKGMLEDTLIVMTGEFGRTPTRDGNGGRYGYGRSHWNRAMSCVMVGGGVKGGTVYGKTDEFGKDVIENKMNIHDLHSTILYALGMDHRKLEYVYNNRPFRLTDVSDSEPLKELFI